MKIKIFHKFSHRNSTEAHTVEPLINARKEKIQKTVDQNIHWVKPKAIIKDPVQKSDQKFQVLLTGNEEKSGTVQKWDGLSEIAFMNIPATGNFGRILAENFKNENLIEKTDFDLAWLKENHPGAKTLTVFSEVEIFHPG